MRCRRVAPPVRHKLAVLPEHERLRAVADAAGGQVLHLGREPLAKLDHEIAHPLAAGPRGLRSTSSPGGGSSRHIDCTAATGPTSSVGSVSNDQTVARYLALIPASAAKSASDAVGWPSAFAVLEPPGGQEIVGVVGPLPLVEIDDPPHAVLVAIGVGDHRVSGAKANPRGFRTRWSATNRAASRYFFTRAGDIASDSAELSKPASLAGSTGNSRVGRMSTPVRSRMV